MYTSHKLVLILECPATSSHMTHIRRYLSFDCLLSHGVKPEGKSPRDADRHHIIINYIRLIENIQCALWYMIKIGRSLSVLPEPRQQTKNYKYKHIYFVNHNINVCISNSVK